MVSVPANLLLGEAYGDSLLTPPLPTDYLIVSLLLSFGYSLFAGWGAVRACRIGHPDPVHATRLGLAAGGALLVVGVAVQSGFWETLRCGGT